MAIAPYVPIEEYLVENPIENSSSRVYIKSVAVVGPDGPPGPAGPAGEPYGALSVKSYGALGNGAADDTTAIEATITAAAASTTERNVFFPPGVYKITRNLVIPPGVGFWGTSRLSSTLMAGANNLKLVSYVATALATDFTIKNLGFSAGGRTNVTGIDLDGYDSGKRLSIVQLNDLYFNCETAVYLKFCANVTLDNCFANVCATGFRLSNVADGNIINCHAQNGSNYGFLIEGGSGAFAEGIKLVSCTTNGQVYGISIIGQDWGQIVASSFTTCTGGPMALSNCKNWRINTTDIAAASAVAGLVVDINCRNIQISECYVALNTFGIAASGSTISVKGCHFEQNSNADIFVDATKSVVANNICDSATSAISIYEVAPGNYNAISGNVTNGTVIVVGADSLSSTNVVY